MFSDAIDDLNDWVGCFGGNPQGKPRNFDRFASEDGMAILYAHAPATVCCPPQSALLTGVHAGKTSVSGNKTTQEPPPRQRTSQERRDHGEGTRLPGGISGSCPMPFRSHVSPDTRT